MKNKYLIPCQRALAMACLLCATPVHYKRLNSPELTNLQKSSKSGLVTAEPLNPDYICQSWLHDFSSHSLALYQSIISHHPKITFICLFLDVVSGMLIFPSARFWWTGHTTALSCWKFNVLKTHHIASRLGKDAVITAQKQKPEDLDPHSVTTHCAPQFPVPPLFQLWKADIVLPYLYINNSKSNAAQGPNTTAAWCHCLYLQLPSFPDGSTKTLFPNAGFCTRCTVHVWIEQVRGKHEEINTGALSRKRSLREGGAIGKQVGAYVTS